jgi:NarL family two-component system sensor histidine kinase LiaS
MVDDVFDPDMATNLYRVVQESLNNILKHSGARHGSVVLERDLHEVHLIIEDDGRGFDTSAPVQSDGGFGLKNLAERARILGGTLLIVSGKDKGTRLELTMPIAETAPEAA